MSAPREARYVVEQSRPITMNDTIDDKISGQEINTVDAAVLTGDKLRRRQCDELNGQLVSLFLDAKFEEILTGCEAEKILGENFSKEDTVQLQDCIMKNVVQYVNQSLSQSTLLSRTKEVLIVGATCLQLFVQNNWTGPQTKMPPSSVLPEPFTDDKVVQESALSYLSEDGEPAYPLCRFAGYLHAARAIFMGCRTLCSSEETWEWWLMRCLMVQQALLEQRSPTLKAVIFEVLDNISRMKSLFDDNKNRDIGVLFHLEAAQVCRVYWEVNKAKEHVQRAQALSSLTLTETAKLGKRTRFQRDYKAQLMIEAGRAESSLEVEGALPPFGLSDPEYTGAVPQNVALEDDTLLPKIELKEGESFNCLKMSPLEQAVAFGVMLSHKGSLARELLTEEQMSAYLEMIIPQVSCWSVAVAALTMRCRLEKSHSRRVERSMLQLEGLINQSERPSDVGPVVRLSLFYAARPHPIWELKCELAAILISLGCIGAALELYEKLHMWEDAIMCYQRLGKQSQAETVIREQLAIKETPSLLCFLGDVTRKKVHYERAWELSNHRSARAMRCLAYILFGEENYAEAVECFEKSLAVNSLQIPVWFTCGCASLAAKNYEAAARSFKRCVNIDYDNFEAWNNLATAYTRLNKKDKAYLALKDSLRCCYDNWRLWENFLVISADCGQFLEVITAYHRLLDIKQKWSDTGVLRVLVKAVVDDLDDANGQPARRLLSKTLELFARLQSKMTLDAELWQLKAYLCLIETAEHPADPTQAMTCLKSSFRCFTQDKKWEGLAADCEKVAQQSLKLAQMVISITEQMENPGEAVQLIYPTKLMLKDIITRIRQKHTDMVTNELPEPLHTTCQNLDRELESIINKVAELQPK